MATLSVPLPPLTRTPGRTRSVAPTVLIENAGSWVDNLCWDERDDSLWWNDSNAGRLQRYHFQTARQSVVYEGPRIGTFLPQEDGSWLLFRERDIARLDFDRHDQVVPIWANLRFDGDHFQEAIADRAGRVLAGTMREGRPNGAGLYRLESGKAPAKAISGTGQSRGMAWSAKDDTLYWACGTTRTIWRFRYDVQRQILSNRQVIHECLPDEGIPSGLALDSEETLWSARLETGSVLKIGANRQLLGQITLPTRHITSIAFGGPDYRTVFLAAVDASEVSRIYMLEAPVPGLPRYRGRIEGA